MFACDGRIFSIIDGMVGLTHVLAAHVQVCVTKKYKLFFSNSSSTTLLLSLYMSRTTLVLHIDHYSVIMFYDVKFVYHHHHHYGGCCVDYFLRDKIQLFFVQFDNYVSRIDNQNNTDHKVRWVTRYNIIFVNAIVILSL